MAVFYEKEGFVEASYLNKIITVRWYKMFNSTIVRECCEAQLEKVKEGARVIIVDIATATGKPSKELQEWFGTYLFPQMKENGLKAIINVIPKNILVRTAANEWNKTGEPFGFGMFETSSLIMARKKAREFV